MTSDTEQKSRNESKRWNGMTKNQTTTHMVKSDAFHNVNRHSVVNGINGEHDNDRDMCVIMSDHLIIVISHDKTHRPICSGES